MSLKRWPLLMVMIAALHLLRPSASETTATALSAIGPKINFQVFDGIDDDPLVGLTSCRRMLFAGYKCILFAIQNVDEAIPLLPQALRSGIIGTILRTGAHLAGDPHLYNEDIKLLMEISSCYLVYEDVLRSMGSIFQRISWYNIQWYAQRDTNFCTAYLELRDTVYQHLAARAEWISGRFCPPSKGCDALHPSWRKSPPSDMLMLSDEPLLFEESLEIELDMTANPMVFRVHPITHYTKTTNNADWTELRRIDESQGYIKHISITADQGSSNEGVIQPTNGFMNGLRLASVAMARRSDTNTPHERRLQAVNLEPMAPKIPPSPSRPAQIEELPVNIVIVEIYFELSI
ncbi:hypothetical protein BJ138DRAFT_1102761 [Hygrophoropsis aurantiaca]|uniref:Uncharacterized protein n=1 Tax=Hygrophoropsis aurantiaca TaxID=72124 RepID=A0ACB8A9I5_9AGAM|nr:hypothetical protein BJ138DRAFT_1102761 [Hygrophoropsis aurantiaca]